jgi:predicted restriction endonuclease
MISDETRQEVLERDGYRCQECGGVLDVSNPWKVKTHHLSYENDEPENLIALCPSCHAKAHELGHKVGWRPNSIKLEDRASITIHYTKKDELDGMIERKGETYDDIVGKLLDCWREHCSKK